MKTRKKILDILLSVTMVAASFISAGFVMADEETSDDTLNSVADEPTGEAAAVSLDVANVDDEEADSDIATGDEANVDDEEANPDASQINDASYDAGSLTYNKEDYNIFVTSLSLTNFSVKVINSAVRMGSHMVE